MEVKSDCPTPSCPSVRPSVTAAVAVESQPGQAAVTSSNVCCQITAGGRGSSHQRVIRAEEERPEHLLTAPSFTEST